MRKDLGSIAGLIVIGLGVSACDSTTAPSLSDQALNAGVAMVAADATIADLETIHEARGGFPLEGERSVTYLDAAGNEQSAFDDLTTATILITSDLSADLSRDTWTATVSRSSTMTITGLEGEETSRTVNGSGTQTASRSRHSDEFGTRMLEMSGTSSIEDVVVGVPRDDNPYPLSGTIRRAMTVNIVNGPDGDGTRSKDIVIIFDGTQFPLMTVDGESYEMDLDARGDQKPFGARRGH